MAKNLSPAFSMPQLQYFAASDNGLLFSLHFEHFTLLFSFFATLTELRITSLYNDLEAKSHVETDSERVQSLI